MKLTKEVSMGYGFERVTRFLCPAIEGSFANPLEPVSVLNEGIERV